MYRDRIMLWADGASEQVAIAEPRQFSTNLYRFMKKQEYLIEALERRAFVPRYNTEDFGFLNMDLGKLAFPMVCFCDIPLEPKRILPHMERYGHYGIGFKKQWGITRGLCPVHYIVGESPYADALYGASDANGGLEALQQHGPYGVLQNLGLSILTYAKPFQGAQPDVPNGLYCYQDECEWRYVPSHVELPERYLRQAQLGELDDYQRIIEDHEQCYLTFEYSGIELLIVDGERAKCNLEEAIESLVCSESEKRELKGKVCVVPCE